MALGVRAGLGLIHSSMYMYHHSRLEAEIVQLKKRFLHSCPANIFLQMQIAGHYTMKLIHVCHRHHHIFSHMSNHMGKPTICIGVNKGADQLRGNCEADQRLYAVLCGVQAALCQTWSKPLIVGFLMQRLIY